MSAETIANLTLLGLFLNVLAFKPLFYAEVLFPDEDYVYPFLVWVAFLMFLIGTLCNMLGGIREGNSYNTGGLFLQIVGTVLVSPEILASLRAMRGGSASHKARFLLLPGGLTFLSGLWLEYISLPFDADMLAETMNGARIGPLLAGFAFFPFLVVSFAPKSLLAANHKALQWFTNLVHVLVLIFVMTYLAEPGQNVNQWGLPVILLWLLMFEDMLELSIARDNGILGFRLMMVCLAIVLMRTGFFFQLFAFLFNSRALATWFF